MRIVLALLLGLLAAAPAKAEPPGWDFYGILPGQFFTCQNDSDLIRVAARYRNLGLKPALKLLGEIGRKLHWYNKLPLCWFGNPGVVQAGRTSLDLGLMPDMEKPGELAHFWIFNAGDSELNLYLLWIEPVATSGA